MLSLDELSRRIAAYRDHSTDFADFEDWFRSNSWGSYIRRGESVSDAIASVEAALSSYEFGEIDEDELREELANAARPVAQSAMASALTIDLVFGSKPLMIASTANRALLLRREQAPA
jgi:hypothetical protein